MEKTKKWFTAKNMTELKEQYRDLAKKFHPDCGGTDEQMAQINAEYDVLASRLPLLNAKQEEYQPLKRENSKKFRDAILAVIFCEGIKIEICGTWLWCTENTLPYKAIFKKAGWTWHSKKLAWSFHDEGYIKFSKRTLSLEEIRNLYGSEEIKTRKMEAIAN